MKLISYATNLIGIFLSLFPINSSTQEIVPMHIERAEVLEYNKKIHEDIQRLLHYVIISHEDIVMYCDSAYLNSKTNEVEAFSNVHIVQGDTLNLYCDKVKYSGSTKMANARNNVKVVNKKTTLTTDFLDFNMNTNVGFYFNGGKIVDEQDTLISESGYYYTKQNFITYKTNVIAKNLDYTLYADTLHHHTETDVITIIGPSTLIGKDSKFYGEKGFYDSKQGIVNITKNGWGTYQEYQIIADTIYYEKKNEFGQGFHNVTLIDTINNLIIKGHYLELIKSEDKAYVTDSAMLLLISEGDTLFLHADTLRIDPYLAPEDTEKDVLQANAEPLTAINSLEKSETNFLGSSLDPLNKDSNSLTAINSLEKSKKSFPLSFLSSLPLLQLNTFNKDHPPLVTPYLLEKSKTNFLGSSLDSSNLLPLDTLNKERHSVVAVDSLEKSGKSFLSTTLDSSQLLPLDTLNKERHSVVAVASLEKSGKSFLSTALDSSQLLPLDTLNKERHSVVAVASLEKSGKSFLSTTLDSSQLLPLDTLNKERHSVVAVDSLEKSGKSFPLSFLSSLPLLQLNTFNKDHPPLVTPYLLEKSETNFLGSSLDSSNLLQLDTNIVNANKDTTEIDTSKQKIIRAYYKVKFYRKNMQGKCDSLSFITKDSTIQLIGSPVIWADSSQLTAELINLILEQETLKYIEMFETAFLVNQTDSSKYNQVKGKYMKGTIEEKKLKYLFVDGNGETIYFAKDKKKIIGINKSTSEEIYIDMDEGTIRKIKLNKSPQATMYPLKKIPENEKFLRDFVWLEEHQPKNKYDIFNWIEAELLNTKRKKRKKN